MADARYTTPEYRAARKDADQAQAAGRWLECHQPECLRDTRAIAPFEPVDIAHDDSGTIVLGPAHQRCNRVDGGKRRHTTPVRRWIL